ncbi:nitroreductase family protein [Clostridium sp. DL-VIII]|uniref:nitroreductase family protein n=1 Tax=Clostridium sp. DL-VIII TaxID=641107 RepID=UPI001FA7F90C|nr:nitroreductase family protein [Clostridium sp. DL-VIII]
MPSAKLKEIQAEFEKLTPLIPGIKTELVVLPPSEMKITIPWRAPHYLVLYSDTTDGYLTNAGFLLQQADLYLSSIGLGSCYVGAGRPANEIKSGKKHVMILAFGVARNSPHRELSEFKRKPISEIVEGVDPRMEAVRLAPSAGNCQAWYFRCHDGIVDIYKRKLGILQGAIYNKLIPIDMGIALCHLWLASQHAEIEFHFELDMSGIEVSNSLTTFGRVTS